MQCRPKLIIIQYI